MEKSVGELRLSTRGARALIVARPRRSLRSGVAFTMRMLVRGVRRAFDWYVSNVLDFAPLLNVLGHTSAVGSMQADIATAGKKAWCDEAICRHIPLAPFVIQRPSSREGEADD